MLRAYAADGDLALLIFIVSKENTIHTQHTIQIYIKKKMCEQYIMIILNTCQLSYSIDKRVLIYCVKSREIKENE